MRIVTDIAKFVTVAATQIILKGRFIKKLVVYTEITESRLFMEEGSARRPNDLSDRELSTMQAYGRYWTKLSVFTF